MNEQNPERETMTLPRCIAQAYWYEAGKQRARFCDKPATMTVRSVGVRNPACDEHGAMMIEAGGAREFLEGCAR